MLQMCEEVKQLLVKRPWTSDEDQTLLAAVEKYGACRWSMIAPHLSTGRVGKQCRERWNNHLCPEVKKTEWSETEDRAILVGVAELGTRWCEIIKAPGLVGRTDNAIKNRYYSAVRKAHRQEKRTDGPAIENSPTADPKDRDTEAARLGIEPLDRHLRVHRQRQRQRVAPAHPRARAGDQLLGPDAALHDSIVAQRPVAAGGAGGADRWLGLAGGAAEPGGR